ncbi:preprotein translocase subunit SecG [Clostridium tetanomorphum]|uniref:Protein-export membrane protein SecG n=1 Tax=Clostridium tetanomorphum TaxID=1553 RepID=A0A923E927_CLOTT|nr:preprotein translocase subunit SecG [Clostridium tetanomorphum]KAJ50390.1 preprotein translocase subunit SecG [Clostridium tetanomorphum DSM 665]MBC2398715.1 preprotein translocase subunit SecG [Clostridium tetanomorphum]MBP1865796.1 preprotein translocase subunit SecG [Clostridium tetanomorphum]NRS86917.1 preprotein translocase subunit SecG [Clostridium tetanomorphum]NRZ99325.1 preprotein translocase subunit SecG [Clostridium tetanomorphum]
MRNVLIVLQVLVSIILIVAVLAQPAKTQGFSLLTGASDTFYSKNKTRTFESTMSRLTAVSAIVFAGITLALNLIK